MSRLNRRKLTAFRSSPLPDTYLRMVSEVIANNFFAGKKSPEVVASGAIFPDEVLLSISIAYPKSLKAMTAHASCDFDPLASSPKADEVLGLCLDAAGSLVQEFLQHCEQKSLSPEDAELGPLPLEWTAVEIEKRKIFVRADRSNPALDHAAEDWLAANDPEHQELEEEEEAEARKLFKTGRDDSGQNGPH